MTVSLQELQDALFRVADQIPLGRRHDLVTPTGAVPSPPDVRPFGLRFATDQTVTTIVDLAGVRYDCLRQVSVDATGVPMSRHTDGPTSTKTSDGYKGMDADSDVRED